jgi:hypothetical protein
MSTNIASSAQHALTGATASIGFLEWVSANTSLVNSGAMVATAVGAIWFGYVNSKSGTRRAMAMEETNRIHSGDIKRQVISQVYQELVKTDLTRIQIENIKNNLHK